MGTKIYSLTGSNKLQIYYGFGGEYDEKWINVGENEQLGNAVWGWNGTSSSSYKFRTKLVFATGNIIIGGKCTVKISAPIAASSYPQKSLAVVSSNNLSQYEVSTSGKGWTGSGELGRANATNSSGASPSGAWGTGNTVYYTITNLELKPNTTYYVYLMKDAGTVSSLNDTGRVQSGKDNITITLDYPEYTKISDISNFKINKAKSKVKETITFSWSKPKDGNNNPVTKYYLYYNNTNTKSSKYKKISKAATSASYTPSDFGYKKGNTIYFWLCAIGVNGFWSNTTSSVNCAVINTAPTAPKFEINGILSCDANKAKAIVFSNFNSTDDDGDSLTYSYCVSSSNQAPKEGYQVIKNQPLNLTLYNTTPYIHVKTSDGTAEAITTKSIPINTRPAIASLKRISEIYPNVGGTYSANELSMSATFNKGIKYLNKYEWQIKKSNGSWISIQNGNFSLEDGSLKEYQLNDIAPGDSISVRLQVEDIYEDKSNWVEFQVIDEKLNQSVLKGSHWLTDEEKEQISISFMRKEIECEVDNKYFNKDLVLTFNFPKLADYMFEHEFSIHRAGVSTIREPLTTFSRSNLSTEYQQDFTIDCSYGEDVKLFVQTNWSNGYSYYSTGTIGYHQMTRLQIPEQITVAGVPDNLICNPQDWDIYDGSSVVFSFANPLYNNNGFFNDEETGGIFYDLNVIFNENLVKSLLSDQMTFQSSDTYYISINKGENKDYAPLFGKLEQPFNKNYDVSYEIILKNAFGEYAEKSIKRSESNNYKIIATSKPKQEGNLTQYIGTSTKKEYLEIKSGDETPKYINPGEFIVFGFDELPTNRCDIEYDKDGNEINPTKRTIKLYRIEYSYDNQAFTKLGDINYSYENTEPQNLLYSIQSNLKPNYLEPEKIYLRATIIAHDGDGKEVKGEAYNLYPIYLSRRENPIVNIKNVELKTETKEEKKFEYLEVVFNFIDYGGNNRKFENFNRNNDGKIKFDIKTGDNIADLTDTENESSSEEKTYNEIEKNIEEDIKLSVSRDDPGKIKTKKYLRIKIFLQTDDELNGGQTTSIQLADYVFYNAGPTMSHRAHWVGINVIDADSTGREDSEVFRINSYDNKSFIILYGENSANSSIKNEIRIDLTTGEFDGVVIGGGEW